MYMYMYICKYVYAYITYLSAPPAAVLPNPASSSKGS